MDLSTVEIPRAGARETAADYMRLAKQTKDPRERQEFEDIARAYRAAALDNVALIALSQTIAAGETMIRTRIDREWSREDGGWRDVRKTYLLPKLAVCTPHSAFCFSRGVQRDGSVEFIDSLGRDFRYRKGVVQVDAGFELPDEFSAGSGLAGAWEGWAWRAMVPIVPPKHRPAGDRFGQRLVLWEVEDWELTKVPRPPRDPALLRPLGGDIYAVEATWDLTELEQLVLSGRRP
jgi:hypothetical protein